MAYDEELAHRIRSAVAGVPGVTEKPMFGGLAFLVGGHLAVSASGQGDLMLRVDPGATASLVQEPHVRRMVMRGREMDGWLRVGLEALTSDDDLHAFVSLGLEYAGSLPPKR